MNTKPVTVVAVLKAKPGKEEELCSELKQLLSPSRKDAGCINYDLHRSTENPAVFVFHENWNCKADLDAHLATPHLQAFFGKAGGLLAEAPMISLLEKID